SVPSSDGTTEPTWRQLRVDDDADHAELISDLLWSSGVQAVEEIPLGPDRVQLRAHIDDTGDLTDSLRAVSPSVSLGWDEVPMSVADTWRQHAGPVHIIDDRWIVPAWLIDRPSGEVLLIEPAGTFGLGDHPTTVLALRAGLSMCSPGQRVHDHGAGSGVLALALSAWRDAVTSTDDIASEARSVIAGNARINGLSEPRWCPDLSSAGRDNDGIVANILAPVLRDHASAIVAAVRVGGWIVLSGMRSEQVDGVLAAYTGCEVEASESLAGWSAVALRKIATRQEI
ncbi:MAG: 50S ribosomal protein L11 methyltransferase, partial [Actinomycetota bacterium]